MPEKAIEVLMLGNLDAMSGLSIATVAPVAPESPETDVRRPHG
jgi:hypothetical protein